MSRAKAKLALLHDLQSKQSDIILTKKDCDMIASALVTTYSIDGLEKTGLYDLHIWFVNLSKT